MTQINVPHLTTASSGPLHQLERHLIDKQVAIETWLREQFNKTQAPLHSSVDLRNAGFKLAPVDTNLFPAGFNNLNPDFKPLCVQAVQATIETAYPGVTRILLVPENHTRNTMYFESLATLFDIIQTAGFDVKIGSLISDLEQAMVVDLPSGRKLTIEPIQRKGDRVSINGFEPCMIFLNNDLASGVPELLKDIEQPVRPPVSLGWSNRLKSVHFDYYQKVAEEVVNILDIDPWLINPLFSKCSDVNFIKREGENCLYQKVDSLLAQIQRKYDHYNVKQKPFVIIKADAGSYGMGVMSISDPEQILKLNRKQRTHMSATKGTKNVAKVIIQEGVYTFETWGEEQGVAEPVVYMLGQHVVGGFYRVHGKRGITENLNAPGMTFEHLAFEECCNTPSRDCEPNDLPNRFYAYGVVARLASLAAARELKEIMG